MKRGGPKIVTADLDRQWFIYTDAAYEPESQTGGLGVVLVEDSGSVAGWFGIPLTAEQCERFGSKLKESIIYELELVAGVVGLSFWCQAGFGILHTWFGDNDSVRFSFIRASGTGPIATLLVGYYMRKEAIQSAVVWFARVPTEANISDYPSRGQQHPLLTGNLEQSVLACAILEDILTCV